MTQNPPSIVLGISSCLLGDPVRFDGGHKRLPFASNELSRHFEFVRVCPEMAIGLGAPRPSLRLVDIGGKIHVRGSRDNDIDVTDELTLLARETARELRAISGYILCAKSPSCGMERVPVYRENGDGLGKIGVGAYAAELMRQLPLLPVEENGRLQDPLLRENFVMRVVAYHRWQQLLAAGLSVNKLQEFHRRHKFLLLAHDQQVYRRLGPMLADIDNLQACADRYIQHFMAALAAPASRKNHVNALMHMQGFLKAALAPEEKQRITDLIHKYRQGFMPLLAVLETLKLFIHKHEVSYLQDQFYLEPYPDDLKLRYGL